MFRSEYADVPPVELPIHDAVLARAAEFGGIPPLIDGTDGTTLSYEQVDRFHRRVAAGLAEAGARKGDVLGRAPSRSWWEEVDKYKGFPVKAQCTVAQRKPSRCRGYDKALRRSAPERHVVRHPTASTPTGERLGAGHRTRRPYQRIRHVTFLAGVPRAASGKILRRQLRERA